MVKSSNNWGQLLKSWHFPRLPSAVVQSTDDIIDSFSLMFWLISTGEEETEETEELSVGIGRRGKATPRTNGAILSVTLRPKRNIIKLFLNARFINSEKKRVESYQNLT